MNDQKDLPKPQTDLPRPEKDLPLPEEKISDNIHVFKNDEEPKKSFPVTKILITIIILLLFIVGIGVAYFIQDQNNNKSNQISETVVSIPTPTPDPTSDWETYENKEFGFYFKHPESYTVNSNELSNGATKINLEKELILSEELTDGEIPEFGNLISFIMYPTFDLSTKGLNNTYGSEDSYITEINEINFTVLDASKTYGIFYFYEFDPEVLSIHQQIGFKNSNSDIKNYKDDFDQILSTFQFTDQESSIDTSEWKTFEGRDGYEGKLSFEIKYPTDCSIKENDTNYFYGNPTTIDCPNNNLRIDPQASGSGANIVARENIVLNQNKWSRLLIGKSTEEIGRAAYNLKSNDRTLIEIDYDVYSEKNQKFVEQIIATFQFTN